MNRKYRHVRLLEIIPEIWSNDPAILEWIYREVKKIIPTCGIKFELFDVTGKRTHMMFNQLQGKDQEVARWLPRLLYENGFEPFAVTLHSNTNQHYFHYRQLVEEE